MKVLLVEDEEFIRDLFKRQLDLSGFTTDAFSNGQDGLAAISKNAYDLVLLDIMLPDINGLQILQNIRSNPTTKGVAVVLLTNLGQDAVIKQGFELGADGYLVKAAYTPDQIVQEVKNIMQKKTAQTQAAQPAPSASAAEAPLTPSSELGVPAFPGQTTTPAEPEVPNFPGQAAAPESIATTPVNDIPAFPAVNTAAPQAPQSAADITSAAAINEEPIPATATPEVTSTNS